MCSCVGRKSCPAHPNSHLHFFQEIEKTEEQKALWSLLMPWELGWSYLWAA